MILTCMFLLWLSGAVAGNERRLYEVLLTESAYRREVRPRRNASDVVVIEVDMELNQIVTLNERKQILYSTCFIVATWQDEYLTWKPEDYGNLKSIILPPSDVWLPDIGFINSADSFYHASFTKDFRVHVSDVGRVMWSFGGNLETSCLLDMTFFPFDHQQCDFVLENWAYTGNQVELVKRTAHLLLTDYHKNGEWLLCHSAVQKSYIYHTTFPGQPFPKLTFRIYLKRKPAFYALNIITPCSFIVLMSLVLFWLPAESGEKASLGITVLLSFSVFQLVVADTIPRTSDAQPVLSLYLAFVMGMSAISTINAVIVLYFHHHLPNYPVPAPIRTVVFGFFALILGMRDQTLNMEDGDTTGHTHLDCRATQRVRTKPQSVRTTLSRDKLIANEASYREGTVCFKHQKPAAQILRSPSAVKLEKNYALSLRKAAEGLKGNLEAGVGEEVIQADRRLDEVAGCIRFLSRRSQTKDAQEAVVRQWRVLGRIIDRLMFFICTAVITVMCMYLFLHRGKQVVECVS